MERYDVKCPFCETINRNLDLEDSNGWMECEHCKTITKTFNVLPADRIVKVPIYTMKQAAKIFAQEA